MTINVKREQGGVVVRNSPGRRAPSASQWGRRDRREEIRKAATTHSADWYTQLPNQTLAPKTSRKRQAMQTNSAQTSPYAPGIPDPRFMTHYTSSEQSAGYPSDAALVACTTLVPSTNRVLKRRFAFWNMPSFRLTTINCEPLNRVLMR